MSDINIAFYEMLVQRLSTLEAKIEDLTLERRLESHGDNCYARVRNGKTIFFDVRGLDEYKEYSSDNGCCSPVFPSEWTFELPDPEGKWYKHLDEVKTFLKPEWHDLIETARRFGLESEPDDENESDKNSCWYWGVWDLPEEHKRLMDPKGSRSVVRQIQFAYLTARFPNQIMYPGDFHLVIRCKEQVHCMDSVFSLFFDIMAALWWEPEDMKVKFSVKPAPFPEMDYDLFTSLSKCHDWMFMDSPPCDDIVCKWSCNEAVEFLNSHPNLEENVIQKICRIHGIKRSEKWTKIKYVYYK